MDLETFEIRGELPIFPLATVLFPGAILPLHIFEDRYKAMMEYAIEHEGQFGLSFRDDAQVGVSTDPEVGSVGCAARIKAAMRLDDGKMNLLSAGTVRYRILEFTQSSPFLIARIDPFVDDPEPDSELAEIFDEVKAVSADFLEALQALDSSDPLLELNLPEDPEAYSLLISSALPIDKPLKQQLLEMTSTRTRLNRLKPYLTAAISNFSDRLLIRERARGNGYHRVN